MAAGEDQAAAEEELQMGAALELDHALADEETGTAYDPDDQAYAENELGAA